MSWEDCHAYLPWAKLSDLPKIRECAHFHSRPKNWCSFFARACDVAEEEPMVKGKWPAYKEPGKKLQVTYQVLQEDNGEPD